MQICNSASPSFTSSGRTDVSTRPRSKHCAVRAASLPDGQSKPRLRKAVLGFAAALTISRCCDVSAAEISIQQQFTQSCAGCHAGGGNIVQRGAGLSMEELKRNNVASSSQIYDLIYNGKGKMPGYGQNCTPKGKCTFAARLTDDQITAQTEYVLQQASEGWKS